MTTTPQDNDEARTAAEADQGDAPPVGAGDDVRVGPEESDEPQAGAAEPTD